MSQYPPPFSRRWTDMFLSGLLLCILLPAHAGVRQLAGDTRPVGLPALNNRGQVAWFGRGLYLWDGTAVRQLAADAAGGAIQGPRQFSDGGQVVWVAAAGSGYAVDLWDGSQVRQLGQYSRGVETPRLNAVGQAVWTGDGQIDLWDGRQVRPLSAGIVQNSHPRLNDAGQVVWNGAGQIYLWDGARVRQISQAPAGHSLSNRDPEINAAGQAAWTGSLDRGVLDVYFWDGAAVSRLSRPGHEASGLLLNDAGRMVWLDTDVRTGWTGLDVWDGTRIQSLTLPGSNFNYLVVYEINDRGEVVWNGREPGDGFFRVLLWDGAAVRDLAGHQIDDPAPQLGEGGQVVWQDRPGPVPELFLWDGAAARQISSNQAWGDFPAGSLFTSTVNRAGQVAWTDSNGAIYLYSPSLPGSLDLQPNPVVEGRTAMGKVTLPQPAPPGGAVVTLTSDNPSVSVPPMVVVPGGTTAAAFPLQTSLLPRSEEAVITAKYGTDIWRTTLQVTHAALAGIVIDPPNISLTLDGPAPPEGAAVTVTADPSGVIDLWAGGPGGPADSITALIRAGQRQGTVTIFRRYPVSVPTTVQIVAAYAGVTRTASLQVLPAQLTYFNYGIPTAGMPAGGGYGSPTMVCGGATIGIITGGLRLDGLVLLAGPAGPAGPVVALTSDNPAAASVPASVTIAPGDNGAGFPIVTHPVARPTAVHLTASTGGVSHVLTLTLVPVGLAALSLAPASVIGGHPVTGTVTLSGPAPDGGAVVTLGIEFPADLPMLPATVTVPAGAVSARFTIPTPPERVPFPVTLFACYGGIVETATLELLPPGGG